MKITWKLICREKSRRLSNTCAFQVVCLHESRAVASALGECLQLRQGDGKSAKSPGDLNIWNVDNAAATFKVCSAAEGCPEGVPFWLNHCAYVSRGQGSLCF